MSPAKSGCGNAISPNPSCATRVPCVSCATDDPTIVDSVGTEFWTAFPQSLGGEALTLFGSPEGEGTVTVTTTTGALVETRSLTAGQVEAVLIPNARSVTGADTIGDQGLHVEATTPVSVYGVSYLNSASTGFQAFPVDALGTTNRVLSYPGLSGGS